MKLIQTPDRDGIAQLRFEGKPEGRFLDTFKRLVDPGTAVVLDLSLAEAFRGDDLEELVLAHHHCDGEGGGLVLACLPHDLRYILGLLQLDQFFSIQETVEEGTQALQQQAAGMPMTTLRMVAIRKEQLEAKGEADVDPEEAARRQIHGIKTSIRYLAPSPERIELLRYLTQLGNEPIEVVATAQALKQDRTVVERGLTRLQMLRIVIDRGGLRFMPRPQVAELIRDILVMWKDPANREKMMEWAAVNAG